MEISALTPEVIKANNPGLDDFGSGNMLALVSQCLRCAKEPTDCTICADFCPIGAIEVTQTGRPRIASSCIKCGACVNVCPTNALSSSKKTLQQINRLALQASLRVNHLVISCERTAALLRLATLTNEADAEDTAAADAAEDTAEKDGPSPEQEVAQAAEAVEAIEAARATRAAEAIEAAHAAQAALDLIAEASASEHVLAVPCLEMLTREVWFSLLNEIGASKLEEVSAFIPPGQCAKCPVNAEANIEDLFGESITTGEIWSEGTVGIIMDADDLPQAKKANVRAYLTSDIEMDRRGAFTGFLAELRQTWDENSQVGNKALDEVRLQRERKATFERTRLSKDLKETKPSGKKPIAVPTRFILIEALGRNDAHASEVRLSLSATDVSTCTLCGTCVNVCPLHARSIIGQDDSRTLVVNDLYCVGCSACIQTCPTESCFYAEVEGSSFVEEEVAEENVEE